MEEPHFARKYTANLFLRQNLFGFFQYRHIIEHHNTAVGAWFEMESRRVTLARLVVCTTKIVTHRVGINAQSISNFLH